MWKFFPSQQTPSVPVPGDNSSCVLNLPMMFYKLQLVFLLSNSKGQSLKLFINVPIHPFPEVIGRIALHPIEVSHGHVTWLGQWDGSITSRRRHILCSLPLPLFIREIQLAKPPCRPSWTGNREKNKFFGSSAAETRFM